MAALISGYSKWATRCILAFACGSGAVLAQRPTVEAPLAEQTLSEESVYREALYHYFLRDYAAAFNVLNQYEAATSIAGGTDVNGDVNSDVNSDVNNDVDVDVDSDTHLVPPKPASARIQRLQAGVALAYGMHDLAHRQLVDLLDDAQQRDIATYYLALLAYRQGSPAQANDHLEKIETLPGQLVSASDLTLLRAEIALQLADPAAASQYLQQLPEGSQGYLLTALNIANYYSRQGNYSQARGFYQVLNKAQTTGGGWLPDWPWTTLSRPEDKQRLIQRARLAAGYAALDAGQFGEAEQWLMTIPENTIGARQAILGYGWSHYQRGDFVQALGAWQALASTPVVSGQISPQEMEAGLGVALAYDRLSQPRLALDQYQSLATYLDQHLGSINSLLVEDRLLVDDEVLMQRYLLSWQASEVYVRQMGRRAELQTLVQQNQDWLGKLDIYRAALQGKDQLRQQQANRVASAGFSQRIAGVQQQQQALAERLSVIKQRQDVTALVSAKQYRLRQRVEKARSSWQLLMTARAGFAADHVGVTDIPTSARLEQADQALRLYAGLLDWDAGLGWHDALWQLEKRQRSAVESLTAAKARQTSIEQLLRDSTDIAPLLAQLEKLQTQLQRQAMQLKQHITAANASLLAGQNSALLAHQEMSRAQMAQIQFNMGAAFDQSTRSVTAGLRAEP